MASWLFAQVYAKIAHREAAPIRGARKRLFAGLHGDVLEIGAGTGLNFQFYPEGVTLTATDYSEHMMKKLAEPARDAAIEITVQQADVQDLPFDDESFDHTVATLVFCSVPQPQRGYAEILRITKPGGSVRFLEHVVAEGPRQRRLQDWITPAWKRIGDGCHLNRDTVAAVRESGLAVDSVEEVDGAPALFPMRVIYAHKPV